MKTPVETRGVRKSTPPGDVGVVVECYALSDVGRTRSHNEDAFAVADLTDGSPVTFHNVDTRPVGQRGVVFMVADGMGGAAAGELASATAVEVVMKYLLEHWTPGQERDPADFVAQLESATEQANGTIFQHASTHPELRGMGTTATIAGLLGDTLYLAQVGDSRAYLVREGVPRQLTKDQSLMQKLIEAGEISEEEALHNERRNIILQALGPEAAIKIDLTHQRVRRGDTLILCSDGLSGLVTGDEIGRVVREEEDLQGVCERLVALANSLGGPDNITVVAARFDGSSLRAPDEGDHVGHVAYEIPGREPSATGSVSDMLREKSDMLFTPPAGTPIAPPPPSLPPALRAERQERSLVVRGVLAAAAVILGGYLIWRLLQLF